MISLNHGWYHAIVKNKDMMEYIENMEPKETKNSTDLMLVFECVLILLIIVSICHFVGKKLRKSGLFDPNDMESNLAELEKLEFQYEMKTITV